MKTETLSLLKPLTFRGLLKGILDHFRKSVTKTDIDMQIFFEEEEEEGGVNYSTSSQNGSWNGPDATDWFQRVEA